MKLKNKYLYLLLVAIQAAIIFSAFPNFILHPHNAMFCTWGDGIKNYFTLTSYVREPIGSGGLFKYNSFAYPFGDYVYYTDNTPLFSIPFRWFCHHIYDVSAVVIPAFNTFILLNIIAASLLVFFIFKALIGKNIFSYFPAIVLPWVNIQTLRIWAGHFNLSYSSLILAAIALFIYWYQHRESKMKHALAATGMVLLLFFAFLMHGYYIAIIGVFLSGMLFMMGVTTIKSEQGKLAKSLSFAVPILALSLIIIVVVNTDKYYHLRKEGAMGYGHQNQKTNFMMLFTHYDFHTIGFPVASTMQQATEVNVYLGNIGLFALGIIWVGAVCSTPFRKRVFSIQKNFFADPLKRAIFLGGMIALMISFGEQYDTNRDHLKIFTPFPFLNKMDTNTLLVLLLSVVAGSYAVVLILSKSARGQLVKIANEYKTQPLKKLTVLFSAALMVYLFVGLYSVSFPNLLNPFFYLHFMTNRVEQFRCLARFSWPFFWSFYVWAMYTVVQLYVQSNKAHQRIILSLFILLGTVEVGDYVLKMRHDAQADNIYSTNQLAPFNKLHIDFKKYQAILPIPYYIVGSEDYPHTIDENNNWGIYTMQLSLASQLPLISCKMSRTPPEFSIALLDMVSNDILSPSLRSKLGSQPILIAMDKQLVNDPAQVAACTSGREPSKGYYIKANGFVTRHHLLPIDSMGNTFYYSWVAE
jgi:hypothetical protein